MGNLIDENKPITEGDKLKLKNGFLEAIDDLPESVSLSVQMYAVTLNLLINYELSKDDMYEYIGILKEYKECLNALINDFTNEAASLPSSTILS